MRYTLLFILLYIFFGCESIGTYQPGETFVKFFGTSSKEKGVDLLKLSDSFLLLGNTEKNISESSIFLVKSDFEGNEEWQKIYENEDNNDESVGMIQLGNGQIVILANRNNTEGILCYTQENGDDFNSNTPIILQPSVQNTGVKFNAIENLKEGGFLVIGEMKNTQEEWDMISIKLDVEGNIIWEKVEGYKGGGNDLGNSSSEDNSQNYYLFGSVDIKKVNSENEEVTVSDMRTVRVNDLGNIVWDKHISTFDNEYGVRIVNYNGDFYVLGRRDKSSTNKDIIFSKLQDNGDAEELLEYGEAGIDIGNDIAINNSGIFITGMSNHKRTDEDILIVKLDFQGNTIWETFIGYEGVDYGSKIFLEEDNSVIIIGTGFFGNNEKICLIKLDSNGKLSKQ